MKLITVLVFSVFVSGCATKQYFHTSISDPAQIARQKAIDEAICTQASVGSAPIPQIAYQPSRSNSYQISGTVSSGNSTSSYSGVARSTPSGSFSQGFANGVNMGTVAAARRAQDKIFHGCMISKGWSEEQPMPSAQAGKRTGQDTALTEWQTAIDQFVKMEAARPDGIDYARDEFKMVQLDLVVKQLASDPRNESKSMQWFLIEADRIVKEHFSPERAFVQKKN